MRSGHSSGLRPINRLFILFHLTTSKKRVAMNCRAERKGCCCHLIPLHCDRETVGWDLCDFGRIPEATECVGIPRIPSFFWIWKGSFHKAVKPYMSANIFSKNLCNQTFTKPLSLWWQPLSMIPLTWSVKDLKCWILWSSTPRHDDTWSFGLHRRKWNNCNGHGNIELPKSVKYLWILSNFIEVMSQQFDTLHFEACSLVIQAMEPWTFCKWSFFLEKRMIFNFQCSISSHKTLVVDLPYLPLPHENHRKVV